MHAVRQPCCWWWWLRRGADVPQGAHGQHEPRRGAQGPGGGAAGAAGAGAGAHGQQQKQQLPPGREVLLLDPRGVRGPVCVPSRGSGRRRGTSRTGRRCLGLRRRVRRLAAWPAAGGGRGAGCAPGAGGEAGARGGADGAAGAAGPGGAGGRPGARGGARGRRRQVREQASSARSGREGVRRTSIGSADHTCAFLCREGGGGRTG